MSRLTWYGTAEPVSRDRILRHARGQGDIHFPCSADHEQDWQPYPVDLYSAICDGRTYIHTYIHIESNLDRLGLLSPTHGQRSQQQSGQITLQSVLNDKPKFLKATYCTRRRTIEIPRSMVVEALDW